MREIIFLCEKLGLRQMKESKRKENYEKSDFYIFSFLCYRFEPSFVIERLILPPRTELRKLGAAKELL